MAIIELSNGFLTTGPASQSGKGYIKRVCSGGGQEQQMSNAGIFPLSYDMTSSVSIMKGSMPTSFSELPIVTSRSTDILVNYKTSQRLELRDIIINNDSNPVTFRTIYKNATAAGTASWFWCSAYYFNSPNIFQQFIGTVGAQGSGADMEISSTDIVLGTAYRVLTSNVQIPTAWTY